MGDDLLTATAGAREAIGRVRWGICALLFCATTINYVDRSVLGILAPTLRTEIGWTDVEYGRISAAFTLAYAIGFVFAGWFIDRVGTRVGYALYLVVWSVAAAAHALAATPIAFGPDNIAELRRAGLDDAEIVDVINGASFFNWANRLMLSLGEPSK
jgi:MFS family permease